MSRANPFDDLTDFDADPTAKPVTADAIDQIAQSSGFPSRKADGTAKATANETVATTLPPASPARPPRRHVTGRNRQINIKATEETIARLYTVADALGLPLGAVLEQALEALALDKGIK